MQLSLLTNMKGDKRFFPIFNGIRDIIVLENQENFHKFTLTTTDLVTTEWLIGGTAWKLLEITIMGADCFYNPFSTFIRKPIPSPLQGPRNMLELFIHNNFQSAENGRISHFSMSMRSVQAL